MVADRVALGHPDRLPAPRSPVEDVRARKQAAPTVVNAEAELARSRRQAEQVIAGGQGQLVVLAGAVAGLLSLVTTVFTLLGVLATPWLIDAIAPGFTGEKRALTILLVRIFFPGTALLVLSAFCLGVLNSHHRFFLSYAAPVV